MITERNVTDVKRRAVSLLRTLTILALAVPILNSSAMAQADLQENLGGIASPIEGGWIFSIDAGPVSFVALASFSTGGVFFGTGSLRHKIIGELSRLAFAELRHYCFALTRQRYISCIIGQETL